MNILLNTEGGDKMKRVLLGVLMMFGVMIARNIDETTGWEYDASTQQAFYMFAGITVDGVDVEIADVLGAFKDGQCIGFTNAIPSSAGGHTTLPLMGQDGPVFGLNSGEVPDEILLYDTSNGSTLSLNASGDLPVFSNNEILGLFLGSKPPNISLTYIFATLYAVPFKLSSFKSNPNSFKIILKWFSIVFIFSKLDLSKAFSFNGVSIEKCSWLSPINSICFVSIFIRLDLIQLYFAILM